MSQNPNLFGRLAVHYKLVTPDQLAEATRRQAVAAVHQPLGVILAEMGLLTPAQQEQLLAVQRQLAEKQAAAAIAPPPVPAAGITPTPVAASTPPASGRRIDRLLEFAVRQGASDFHLASGEPVRLRVRGELLTAGERKLSRAEVEPLIREILDGAQQEELLRRGQVDFAISIAGVARFRGNAFRHQTGLSVALRAIPLEVPSLADLGLPTTLARLTNYHQGLVLLTGPAGCGKSSTLAALLRIINEERRDHIITIEDPIEFVHSPIRCVVNQRQVGRDTGTFARALRAALREDPDVIAIGELRDLETISLALTAAETGHLVLATLHTGSAIRTLDRIVGAYPPDQQAQIRTMLSESLRAVVSQRLLRRSDALARVPALEVLFGTRAVANLVRENKTFQIRSILQTGGAQGMTLLDASLARAVKERLVTREEALQHAEDPKAIPA
ncbi:MAG: type IV pilus twitching motility protein PilT [Thermoanaerobaculia bacterium]